MQNYLINGLGILYITIISSSLEDYIDHIRYETIDMGGL